MINFLRGIAGAIMYRVVKVFGEIAVIYADEGGVVKYVCSKMHIPRKDVLDDERASYGRLDAINNFLPENEALSVIDVGCNLGFFTFKMAERGGFCIGIDYGRNEILAAKALAYKNSVDNIVFAQKEITPENASMLPKADMVICLSIFHHWIRKLGEQKEFENNARACRFCKQIFCLILVSQMKRELTGIIN